MFSATMPPFIRILTQKYLNNPAVIDLVGDNDQKLADGISLYSIAVESYGKASILGPLITEHAKGGKCIIFTQRKRDADNLAFALSRSYKCEALHGGISQQHRERALSGFRDGCFDVLVATDVAARGLMYPMLIWHLNGSALTKNDAFNMKNRTTPPISVRFSVVSPVPGCFLYIIPLSIGRVCLPRLIAG